MDQALSYLIKISRSVGKDPALVQAGGGNTSVKTLDGKYMFIKASGTAIKDISEQKGWRRLKMESVKAILTDHTLIGMDITERETSITERLRACCEDDISGDARPSVEAHLHALLDRCVIHLHPVAVGAFVCAKNGKAEIAKRFTREKLPPFWVPYTDPGYLLAMKVARMVDAYAAQYGKKPSILFLEKHGLLVAADDPNEVIALVQKVIAICTKDLKRSPVKAIRIPSVVEISATQLAIRGAIWKTTGERLVVRHFLDEEIAAFIQRADAQKLTSLPPLTPDEIACVNGSPMWLDNSDLEAIAKKNTQRIENGGKPAAGFVMKSLGLFVAGTEKSIPGAKDLLVAALQMRAYSNRFGGPNPLNKRQRDFIAKWEAEAFRHSLLVGASVGALAGQIAVVTGAGSGLGRSIATGLARAGALVALADVDGKTAEQTATAIRNERSGASVMALRCNVTDELQVEQTYQQILQRWGGLDILVNAAGVAPPYPLVDLPVEKWRLALEINLTGYFLMAKHAAKAMIQQGMGGNIINLSSKSGLEASKNNTPYNATKAGEIHMARGWALELGQYGIRVNSVAPGNVFEGSKIWNPDYIKECAKKYGIKPEEVIPYYINLTALKRDITGQDIANAIIFLCSGQARTITGQTLVADSGQVMVR